MNDFEIAPAAIARIASIPFEVLSELRDPSLVDQAESACAGRCAWPAYESAYQASIDARQDRLWALTAGDPQFMVALAFANPRLAERVGALPARAPRTKNRRHLETTLYRFLARGAGRPEPFGLWAAVSLVRWGTRTRITRVRRSIKVEPELRPLFALVRALARVPRYRSRGPWRLNPSLHRSAEDAWSFHAPVDGGAVFRRIDSGPPLDDMLHQLRALEDSDRETLAGALAPYCGSESSTLTTIEACIDGGVLVGGLQPPWRFATAWEALQVVEESLTTQDRGPWADARIGLRAVCSRLEDRGDAIAARDVLAGMADSGAIVRKLAESLDLPCPELPGAALRCDMRSPYDVELGEDIRAGIERTLDAYLAFQGEYGFGAAIRRAVLARYVSRESPLCPLGAAPSPPPNLAPGEASSATWQSLRQRIGGDADFLDRIDRWEALLRQEADPVAVQGHGGLIGPPFGWLQLAFAPSAGPPGEMIVHGVHDDLWGPYARHASLWSATAGHDALGEWIHHRLFEIERSSGIALAELVVPSRASPNVLGRPPLGLPAVCPWSDMKDAVPLQGASIALEAGSQAPVLLIRGASRPMAVLNAASADVQSGDPIVQQLLTTSLGAVPGLGMRAANVLFACERDAQRASPTVALAEGGAIVRARRHVLGSETVRGLLRGDSARRFAAWAQLARRLDWPRLLLVRREGGLALPVHRDSPLAVAAALAGAGAGLLTVEQGPEEAWVGEGAERHVAELSIPFLRRQHIWSGVRAQPGSSTETALPTRVAP